MRPHSLANTQDYVERFVWMSQIRLDCVCVYSMFVFVWPMCAFAIHGQLVLAVFGEQRQKYRLEVESLR